MKTKLTTCVFLILSYFLSAQGDEVVWSQVAMTMVPTSQTAQENKYITTGGRIKFKEGEFGMISFLAPITTSFPEDKYTLAAKLMRTQKHLLGTTVQLRKANKITGHVETILECVTIPSAAIQNNIMRTTSLTKEFKIDTKKFFYWVQVTDKNSQPASPRIVDAVLGVSLIRSR